MKIIYRLQFFSFLLGLLVLLLFFVGRYTEFGKTFFYEPWYYDPIVHQCLERDTLIVTNDLGGYQEEQSLVELGECLRWKDIRTGQVYTRQDVIKDLRHKTRPFLLTGLGFIILWFLLWFSGYLVSLIKKARIKKRGG